MARGREPESTDGSPVAKDKISVPANKVGKIIGRRGAMIRELQDKSGATIDVTDEQEEGRTVIRLSGALEDIEKAKTLLARIYQDEPRSPQKSGDGDATEEFEIPEDKCGLVIGSRGSKIREIQSDTGVGVNVGSRDTAVNGLIKVTLKGDKEKCDHAKKIILDLISDADNGREDVEPAYSTNMTIPLDMTRKLIGPQGSTIRDIQDRSGAQVDVARRNTAVDGMIEVTLSGAKESCESAKDMISSLVEESSHPAETVLMMIEESMCGLIIGARGAKIRSIQDNSGASIRIDKRNEARDGKVQVTITGSANQCVDAKEEIEHIISEGGSKESKSRSFDASEHVIEIYVPESRCGMIIGRGGSKIAEIQERTSTRVDVNSRERDERGMCLVTISGDEENCKEAEAIVQGIVDEEERERGDRGDRGERGDRGDRGGRGGRGEGGERRERGERGDGEDRGPPIERGSMDIWVETSSLGRIIGKGGAKIREIERMHGVKIDVKKDVKEENETKVILIGAKEEVLSARDYIYDIVDEEV